MAGHTSGASWGIEGRWTSALPAQNASNGEYSSSKESNSWGSKASANSYDNYSCNMFDTSTLGHTDHKYAAAAKTAIAVRTMHKDTPCPFQRRVVSRQSREEPNSLKANLTPLPTLS